MKILVLISLFLLVACGPSEEEKQNVAIITCNIMEESNNMDAAMRIKEINEAREKINEDPFLFGDNKIIQSFQYELCTNLVLNDPNYDVLLKEKRLAAEEAQKKILAEIEKQRLAEEEAKRIKKLKEEEAVKIAKKKSVQKMKANGFCEIEVVGTRSDNMVLVIAGTDYALLELGDSYKTSKDSFKFEGIYTHHDNEVYIVWENEKTGDKYGNAIGMSCE
tara:strand:+ start:572 stop:1231 length:660 start_codon:yes stop_codon:yes gene_type:complete